jgi:hypothetical protein
VTAQRMFRSATPNEMNIPKCSCGRGDISEVQRRAMRILSGILAVARNPPIDRSEECIVPLIYGLVRGR